MIVCDAVGVPNAFQHHLAITTRRDSLLTAANNRLNPKRLYTEAHQQRYLILFVHEAYLLTYLLTPEWAHTSACSNVIPVMMVW